MTVIERIKEIEKLNDDVWGPESHAYTSTQFLLRAFREMASLAYRYKHLTNVYAHRSGDFKDQVDQEFEECMSAELAEK